jgi:hypothetical protein
MSYDVLCHLQLGHTIRFELARDTNDGLYQADDETKIQCSTDSPLFLTTFCFIRTFSSVYLYSPFFFLPLLLSELEF